MRRDVLARDADLLAHARDLRRLLLVPLDLIRPGTCGLDRIGEVR